MIDIGLSKLMIVGVVALVVIGPEKLPRVARTAGALLGRAQRYINDLRTEVTQQMNVDEMNAMKKSIEDAARNVEATVSKSLNDTNKEIEAAWSGDEAKPDYTPQESSTGTLTTLTPHAHDASQEAVATVVQTPSILQAHARDKIKRMESKPAQYEEKGRGHSRWRAQRAVTPLWYKRRTRNKGALLSDAAKHSKQSH